MLPFCVHCNAMAVVDLESDSNSFLSVVYSIRCASTMLRHLELQGIAGVLSSPPWSFLLSSSASYSLACASL